MTCTLSSGSSGCWHFWSSKQVGLVDISVFVTNNVGYACFSRSILISRCLLLRERVYQRRTGMMVKAFNLLVFTGILFLSQGCGGKKPVASAPTPAQPLPRLSRVQVAATVVPPNRVAKVLRPCRCQCRPDLLAEWAEWLGWEERKQINIQGAATVPTIWATDHPV